MNSQDDIRVFFDGIADTARRKQVDLFLVGVREELDSVVFLVKASGMGLTEQVDIEFTVNQHLIIVPWQPPENPFAADPNKARGESFGALLSHLTDAPTPAQIERLRREFRQNSSMIGHEVVKHFTQETYFRRLRVAAESLSEQSRELLFQLFDTYRLEDVHPVRYQPLLDAGFVSAIENGWQREIWITTDGLRAVGLLRPEHRP